MRDSADAERGVAAVFGRAAPTYDSVIPYFATFARHLVYAAKLETGMRVLDLACGRGACLRVAAEAVGPEGFVVGIDLSEGMVAMAAADLHAGDVRNAEVGVGDAAQLEFFDGAFDIVVCGLAVFFFPDPLAALVECRRVLRPGGRLGASTFANGMGSYTWLREVAGVVGRESPLPESPVLTAEGLRKTLQLAGFVDCTSTEVEGRFVYSDVDAFLAWSWSTAGRRLLETLDSDEMDAYRSACSTRLAEHAVDGGYEFRQVVDLTVATRR
jgi:ubiquinone/menaquinone biosynthesis C-methylase UbiE